MKTYIIHVSDAYERENFIKKEVQGKDLDVVMVTDGDKKDLKPQIIEKYFKKSLAKVSGATSCAYKHVLAYEYILQNNSINIGR